MGRASSLPAVPEVDRARVRAKLEPLLGLQQRFSRSISISNEIDAHLPARGMPLGCIHEVQSHGLAAGTAFASLLAGRIPSSSGRFLYVASHRGFYPLGLMAYGVQPEQWIHVSARGSQNLAWAVLEALRCPQVSAVLAVMKSADLTLCRRLQLAAEDSGVTGFLLTDSSAKAKASIASVITRWQITSVPAPADATFTEPRWDIDLTYCRGGQPGRWSTLWKNGQLEAIESTDQTATSQPPRKIGARPVAKLAG